MKHRAIDRDGALNLVARDEFGHQRGESRHCKGIRTHDGSGRTTRSALRLVSFISPLMANTHKREEAPLQWTNAIRAVIPSRARESHKSELITHLSLCVPGPDCGIPHFCLE